MAKRAIIVLLLFVAVVTSADEQTTSGKTVDTQIQPEQIRKEDTESAGSASSDSLDGDQVIIEILETAPAECERKTKRYDKVFIHYTSFLTATGEQFDASFDRNEPIDFLLGGGSVIRGFDEGVYNMCVGEKRKLIIPPSKAYGSTGAGKRVPPNATLTFEIELVKIEDGQPPVSIFKTADTNSDRQLSSEEVLEFLKSRDMVGTDPGSQQEAVQRIFAHDDKDNDGFITYNEFSGPKLEHDEL